MINFKTIYSHELKILEVKIHLEKENQRYKQRHDGSESDMMGWDGTKQDMKTGIRDLEGGEGWLFSVSAL